MIKTRFKCVICGKLTAGRISQSEGFRGDGSHRYPRKSYVNGKIYPDVIEDAEWVDTTKKKNLKCLLNQ